MLMIIRGNSNNGAVSGAVVNAKGYTFDETDDYVDMGDTLDQATNDFSIALWFKHDAISSRELFLSKMNNSANYEGYNLQILSTGEIEMDIQSHSNDNSFRIYTNNTFDDN